MDKYFDFDQFMAEREEKPVIIKIFGEEEQLPASLPADIVLKVIAMQKNPNATVSESQLFEMATKIFGDKLQVWCDKGLTVNGLEALVTNVFALYTDQKKQIATNKAKTSKKKSSTP